MFSPRGMFTRRDTADQIWKAFRSALMWAKVKSYLRHSKERGVRGLSSPCLCQCVFSGRQAQKKISTQSGRSTKEVHSGIMKTCQNISGQKGASLSARASFQIGHIFVFGALNSEGHGTQQRSCSCYQSKGKYEVRVAKAGSRSRLPTPSHGKLILEDLSKGRLLQSAAHIFTTINALTLWSHQKPQWPEGNTCFSHMKPLMIL